MITLDYSTQYDDNSRFSHYNCHVCESSEIIDAVTAFDLVISTDNPLISINNRQADSYELTPSTNFAISNGSQPDIDQHTDDSYSAGINHPQLSSANLPVVTNSGHNIYAVNSNTQKNYSYTIMVQCITST